MGIRARDLDKTIGDPPNPVLKGISLAIDDGEFVALTGRSGSGKSTLLYLLSSLDTPTGGRVEIDGRDVASMSADELHAFRNEKVGFVFQFHYLLAELTALENVLMPARREGRHEELRAQAVEWLGRVGLQGKEGRLPRQLSGGEQQRVAIARALVMKPRYLFADEPTGALDTLNGEAVMALLREVNEVGGTTIVLVTHEPDFAKMAKRQVHLMDGRVVGNPVGDSTLGR